VSKKKNGNGAGEKLGKETRIVRRELDEDEIEKLEAKLGRTYETQRQEQANFTSFRKWAEPRARRALDPDYESKEGQGEATLSIADARALMRELELRRAMKSARITAIKAERKLLLDQIAEAFEHRVVECDLIADPEKFHVNAVDPETGEVIDSRAMTGAERQMMLPGDELPGGAPSALQ
jgi:hypothetical protein